MAETAPRIRRIIDRQLCSADYSDYVAERIETGSYARPSSDARNRYDRCYAAAENGSDGSTYRESIDDIRDYFRAYLAGKARRRPFGAGYARIETAIDDHCDGLIQWFTRRGDIDAVIG